MMRTPRLALVLFGALSLVSCFGGKKVPPTLLTLDATAAANQVATEIAGWIGG